MAAKKSTPASSTTKQLTRSKTDKVIAGVAGGLAEYFNIDAAIIRIILVILAVIEGGGIILYFILWLIIPAAKTSTNPEQTIRNNAEEMKNKVNEFSRNFGKPASDNSRLLIGGLLLILGLMFILDNIGFLRFLKPDQLWPLLLIVLGLAVLLRK